VYELEWSETHNNRLVTLDADLNDEKKESRDGEDEQQADISEHYFEGSIAVTLLLKDPNEVNRPFTYVVYFNRSRGDRLKGGLRREIKAPREEEVAYQVDPGHARAMKRAMEQ